MGALTIEFESLVVNFRSVAPSAVLVNIEKCVTSRTDLVAEDCLSQILKKPGNIFIVLSVIDKPLQPRLLRQRPQLSLDALELARRESALSVKGGSYHTVSLLSRRLCSVHVSLGVSQKVRPERLHVRGALRPCSRRRTDSYRVVSQGGISSRESWANFAIRVDSRDSFKERFERTKSARRLLRHQRE